MLFNSLFVSMFIGLLSLKTSAQILNLSQPFDNVYRGAWLHDEALDYTQLKERGVTTILNLHTTADDEALCSKFGMHCIHHPILILPFFDVCQSDRTFQRAFWKAKDALNEGETLYVHCKHGSDRTGLLIAALQLEELLCQNSNKDVSFEERNQIIEDLHQHKYHAKLFPGIRKKLSNWIVDKPEWLCQKPDFIKKKRTLSKKINTLCNPDFIFGY